MMKRLLLAAFLTLIAAPAFAATCSNTSPQLKDNAGTTFNAPYVDDGTGTGDCAPNIQINSASNVSKETGGNLATTATNTGNTATSAATTATNTGTTATNTGTTATNTGTTNTDIGPPGATACSTDTASCSLNALLQRIAQRISSLITALGSPMQSSGGSVTANAGTNLNTSALALETGGNLASVASSNTTIATNTGTTATNTGTTATNTGTTNTDIGPPGATACATDTASCSVNALLQRIAQRITTLITNIGTQLYDGSGYLEVNVETATGLAAGSTTSGQTGSMIMAATTSAPPSLTTAQTNYLSTDLNGGLRTAPSCVGNTIPINQTTSGGVDVHTFTGYGYICSIVLISGTQQSIGLAEGTGSVCGTGTAYLMGGSGGTMVLAQYGGFSAVSGTPFMKLKNSADHLCVLQSSTGNVSGFITFADLTN